MTQRNITQTDINVLMRLMRNLSYNTSPELLAAIIINHDPQLVLQWISETADDDTLIDSLSRHWQDPSVADEELLAWLNRYSPGEEGDELIWGADGTFCRWTEGGSKWTLVTD